MDKDTDIFNISAEFIDGGITFAFSREMVTGDKTGDVTLDIPRHWIWAIGEYIEGSFSIHCMRGASTSPIDLSCPGICIILKM